MDRPQIIQDNRTLCVCLVFNSFTGPFCKALQDKLSHMVVFERHCSAQRKRQAWNTENRSIKIHHFDPVTSHYQGGKGGTTHTFDPKPPNQTLGDNMNKWKLSKYSDEVKLKEGIIRNRYLLKLLCSTSSRHNGEGKGFLHRKRPPDASLWTWLCKDLAVKRGWALLRHISPSKTKTLSLERFLTH